MTAPAISRQLRLAGFNPVSTRNREGLRVTSSVWPGRVRVCADVDSDRAARDLAIAARQALKGAGYTVQTTDSPAAFYVTGRA